MHPRASEAPRRIVRLYLDRIALLIAESSARQLRRNRHSVRAGRSLAAGPRLARFSQGREKWGTHHSRSLLLSDYQCPIQQRECDGSNQDQGLAEIHAGDEDCAQEQAKGGEEISGGQGKHGGGVGGAFAAEDGERGAAYGVVEQAGYSGECDVPLEVAG